MSTPDRQPDEADGRGADGRGADGRRADSPDVNLTKDAPEPPFDPYRFGKPDHPVPPEYAPPGYVPDSPAVSPPPGAYPSAPYGQPPAGGQGYGQPPYGQPSYGQTGYPYPPAPSYPHHNVQAGPRNNPKAVTALVLGIIAIPLSISTALDVVLVVPAIVFGILGLVDAKSRGGRGRTMAIAGIACAVIGAVIATVLTFALVRAANECGGFENGNDPGFEQCFREHYLD